MALMSGKTIVTMKLPQLQNFIKRDPLAYKEEWLSQKKHFYSEIEIFRTRPTKDSERFTDLVMFLAHTASCYRDDTFELPFELLALLEEHAMTLHADVRAKILQALILLRSKSMVDPLLLIRLSFKLFSVPDKTLRVSLGEYIINDIKSINACKHANKLNRSVQAMLFNIVGEDNSISARKTVQILAELYRKRIWTDSRTVNVLGSASLSPITRVSISAINFFLGIETQMHLDDEDEKSAAVNDVNLHDHSKKTKKRQRSVDKQIERNLKAKKAKEDRVSEPAFPLFPAIQLLHNPQAMAEKLLKKLKQTGERFEVKLLLMNFISRLVGCHKLILLSFYSFLQRYLTSHQKDVTGILAFFIQACHDLVPPEDILPVVKAIANNFITERSSNEVIAVGINAVREILSRVPSLLREPDMGDFIQDLVQYGKKMHKSVMVAAHGIINLVRELYPALLRKGDRGKYHNISSEPNAFGDATVFDGVDGADLLEAYERGDVMIDEDDNVVWKEDVDMSNATSGQREDHDNELEAAEAEDSERFCEDFNEEDCWLQVDESVDDKEEDDEEDEDNYDIEEEEEDIDDNNEEEEDSVDEEEDIDGVDVGVAVSSDATKDVLFSDANLTSDPDRRIRDVRGRVEARRILTSEDFALIARLRAAAVERALDPRFRSKGSTVPQRRQAYGDGGSADEDSVSENPSMPFAVNPDSLGPGTKTKKMTKIERMSRVLEGRKERPDFSTGTHGGGLTNKEKERKKNYVMVRKGKVSVANKIRKSNSDQRYDKMTKREQIGREKRKRRRT